VSVCERVCNAGMCLCEVFERVSECVCVANASRGKRIQGGQRKQGVKGVVSVSLLLPPVP
jgi:hypothetical protein